MAAGIVLQKHILNLVQEHLPSKWSFTYISQVLEFLHRFKTLTVFVAAHKATGVSRIVACYSLNRLQSGQPVQLEKLTGSSTSSRNFLLKVSFLQIKLVGTQRICDYNDHVCAFA